MIPALLPPPAPFKLFVLAAGVAKVRPLQFVTAIAVARGARYLALGVLADLLRRCGARADADARPEVALVVVGVIVLAAVVWWLLAACAGDAQPAGMSQPGQTVGRHPAAGRGAQRRCRCTRS